MKYFNVLPKTDNLKTKGKVKHNSNSINDIDYNVNKKNNDNNTNKSNNNRDSRTVPTVEISILIKVIVFSVIIYKVWYHTR